MNKLIYPTVDVFLYDLREGLGQTAEDIDLQRQYFWKKVYREIDTEKLAQLKQKERNNVNYIQLEAIRFEPDLDGYYYAVQFNNTYALKVNCSGKKKAK